jgi:two-component system chemotaxis sensor kinase CheA
MTTDLAQYQELYLQTSKELINTMKSQLEVLHTDLSNKTGIDEFHRAAHSLKSQSLVMGYQQLGTVNRQLEAFFKLVQENEISLSEEYISMLKNIINHIEHAIIDIDKSEHEPDLTEDIYTLQQHTNISKSL